MPYREGCSSACSSWDNTHDQCSGIGSLDQDGSQLLCRCHCHRVTVEQQCPTCKGKGIVKREEHDYPRRKAATPADSADAKEDTR